MLAGARLRAAHQDGEHRFRLAFDLAPGAGGGRRDLVLDLDPDLPRAHLAAAAPAAGAPTPLASALRNLLEGARLEGARAVPGERALALTLSLAGLVRTLWFEGFGRQANWYALDEQGVVRLTPRGSVATARGAPVGARFVPAPPRAPLAETEPDDGPGGASAHVERLVAEAEAERAEAEQRAHWLRRVRQSAAKAAGTVAALEHMQARGAEAPALRRRGELLRASFHLLREGLAHATLPDYTTDPPGEVEVELDPALAPGEQVARCFRDAEKAERAEAEARARLPDARAQAQALAALAAEAEAGLPTADLAERGAALGLGPAAPRAPTGPGQRGRRGEPVRASPWHTYTSRDGWRILVGRDARGNDALTLHEARPDDLWLHVRGAGGSHVVVPTPRGKSVPLETLLDAAELACLHSTRREAEHNEVDHVPRRYVRKPRGAPPGTVTLEREKTLRVRRDPARRERLKATRAGPES